MPSDEAETDSVHCRLDELLAERQMTLTRLSELVGVTLVNLSVLKNDRARAIRFSTLSSICVALQCEIGELLVMKPTSHPEPDSHSVPVLEVTPSLATL